MFDPWTAAYTYCGRWQDVISKMTTSADCIIMVIREVKHSPKVKHLFMRVLLQIKIMR